MKGIIRIMGLDYKGFSYTYWSLFVMKEIVKRVKRKVGSTAIKQVTVFFRTDRQHQYRSDFLLVSCPSGVWQNLKNELEWRYICQDSSFRFNKRKQSWVKTDVNFWTEEELRGEHIPATIHTRHGLNEGVEFDISPYSESKYPFLLYKPFYKFDINVWPGNYEKNLETGNMILRVERKWKREDWEHRWRKRKAWKPVNGNYQDAGY